MTTDLVTACSTGRRIAMTYSSEAGARWRSEVDPWALVVRHGRWYLLCWSHAASARRAYRVDRIAEVEVLTTPAAVPADLDPVAMLEQHLAVGWDYAVEVVVESSVDQVRRYLSPALGRLEAVDADHTRLTGTTGNPYWYAEQLAVISVPYRIVQCPELRETARVVGQRLITAAADSDT